ncbi:hypothetical protein VTK56DRAFT_2568 [Thermocarpiscus australiensis]
MKQSSTWAATIPNFRLGLLALSVTDGVIRSLPACSSPLNQRRYSGAPQFHYPPGPVWDALQGASALQVPTAAFPQLLNSELRCCGESGLHLPSYVPVNLNRKGSSSLPEN